MSNSEKQFSRRHFLSAIGATSMLIGACSKSGNPVSPNPENTSRILKPGAIQNSGLSSAKAKVATASIEDYDPTNLRTQIESMFQAIGGLSDIIKPGDKVGIKINCTGGAGSANSYRNDTGLEPHESYWTHPEIMKIVGELAKDAGAGKVTIVEAIYDEESINDFGFIDVIDYLGADFVDLNGKAPYSDYAVREVGPNAKIYENLTQNGILNDFDCFISLPKAKQHRGAGVTHGMKNLVGTLPVPSGIYNAGQGHRAGIHEHRTAEDNNTDSNLRRVLMDLNNATPIHLVVNDAIWTVLNGEGPWNRNPSLLPRQFNTLIAGKDPVATDTVSTQVIGFDPMVADDTGVFKDGLNYLRLASELGMGIHDVSEIEVIDATVSTHVALRPMAA